MKRPIKSESPQTTPKPQPAIERRLLKSAWKEALGDLTPGLAHDFNNVLTGVLATSEACLGQMDPTHAFYEGLSLIKQNACEASRLIHRLSRLFQEKSAGQSYHDLNSIVSEMAATLQKVIPRRIEVSTDLALDSLPIFVDLVEFDRVLLSLAFGAVNSIPGKGKLQFRTARRAAIPKRTRFHGELACLPAACLSIADSAGSSLGGELDLVFESLALATECNETRALSLYYARHFIEKCRGLISIESAPGAETTLNIWLPQSDFTESPNDANGR